VRVLLADNHPEVRWALRTVVREQPGLVVVGEVLEAGDLLGQAQILQPDLILLAWELSGQTGERLLSALHALDPRLRVIVLSGEPEARLAALAAGADAFVCKADAPEQLLSVLSGPRT
jgi:two-component system nitrate/nitrite response regulator NarL